MAKFTMSFEGNEVKKELNFRGKVYDYTMKPCNYGHKGDKPCIYSQFESDFSELLNNDLELQEHVDNLDFGSEDDILEAMLYICDVE